MTRYMEFNAKKFLKESRGWKEEKKRLREELDELASLKGAGDSPARTFRHGDSTGTAVVERSRIQSQIDRISLYEEAFKYAWESISEASRDVLTAFFFAGGCMSRNVTKYGAKYGVCNNEVYKRERVALAEVSRLITRRYGL